MKMSSSPTTPESSLSFSCLFACTFFARPLSPIFCCFCLLLLGLPTCFYSFFPFLKAFLLFVLAEGLLKREFSFPTADSTYELLLSD